MGFLFASDDHVAMQKVPRRGRQATNLGPESQSRKQGMKPVKLEACVTDFSDFMTWRQSWCDYK